MGNRHRDSQVELFPMFIILYLFVNYVHGTSGSHPSSIFAEVETPHIPTLSKFCHTIHWWWWRWRWTCVIWQSVMGESAFRLQCAHFNPIIPFKPISGFSGLRHTTALQQRFLIQQATDFILSVSLSFCLIRHYSNGYITSCSCCHILSIPSSLTQFLRKWVLEIQAVKPWAWYHRIRLITHI